MNFQNWCLTLKILSQIDTVNYYVDDMLNKGKTEVAKVSVSGLEEINESTKKICT